jgi:predicted SprT family Zn-dependent metalloprotease
MRLDHLSGPQQSTLSIPSKSRAQENLSTNAQMRPMVAFAVRLQTICVSYFLQVKVLFITQGYVVHAKTLFSFQSGMIFPLGTQECQEKIARLRRENVNVLYSLRYKCGFN